MTKSRNNQNKNTSAPATPGTPAEVLAPEGAQASSQATTQAGTGNSQPVETKVAPLEGDSSVLGDEAHRAEMDQLLKKPGEPHDTAASIGGWPRPTHIVVTAMKDGFRRAGRAWSKEPTTVPIDEFTQEQIEALTTEPMLVVALSNATDE